MFVAATGGISPPARKRRGSELTFQEREEISRGLSKGESQRSVAARLRRAVSTVSREVARNGGSSQYRAAEAETAAWLRARRPKVCRLAEEPRLRGRVAFKLSQNWSPEQIAGWLKQQYPNDDRMRISHETIYRSLFIQARGVLKADRKSEAGKRPIRQGNPARARRAEAGRRGAGRSSSWWFGWPKRGWVPTTQTTNTPIH